MIPDTQSWMRNQNTINTIREIVENSTPAKIKSYIKKLTDIANNAGKPSLVQLK